MVFVKGQSGNPAGKPKGIKNRETLIKEERRAIFEAEISKTWLETIHKLPPTYVADQFMGKAVEEHTIHLDDKLPDTDITKIADEASKLLKNKKL